MKLPTKKSQVASLLSQLIIMIYGPPGVGKTTWASKFKNVLFAAAEDGQRFLSVFKVRIKEWSDVRKLYKLLRGPGGKRYDVIAFDTADIVFDLCEEYCGKKHKFSHPSDLDWGKGFELVRKEFQRAIVRIASLGKGIIFISHEVERQTKTRTLKISKTMPSLAASARKVIEPMCDIIIHAGFSYKKDKKTRRVVEKRVATVQPSESLLAKDRTGRLPRTLPLSAKAFLKAFASNVKTTEE